MSLNVYKTKYIIISKNVLEHSIPVYVFMVVRIVNCNVLSVILTTNLAAVVCVCVDVCQCAKFDHFLPARSYFESIRPENFVRIAKFPYAAFGPLFAFHCPLFFTINNDLECKSSDFAVVVRRSVADKQLA